MRVQDKKRPRTNDVVILLQEYQRERDVVAWQRLKYAIQALEGFWVGKGANDINIASCRAYKDHRLAYGAALSTIARELTVLRAACNHAVKWERLDKAPQFEIPTNLPKRDVWLFKDELRALMREADDPIFSFIKLAYGTGSRRSAIEKLEWDQINFARKTISLAKPNERVTCKRRPTVPMGELHSWLVSIYPERKNQFVLGTNRDLLYDFQKVCERAGLTTVEQRDGRPAGKVTPHVLRHSRATHLLEDGVSIYAVAKLIGDSPMTVQNVYGHICMASLEDELNKSRGVL